MIHQYQISEGSAGKSKALLEEFYADSPERLKAALYGLGLTVKKPSSDVEQDWSRMDTLTKDNQFRTWFVRSPIGICALLALVISSAFVCALEPRYCFATNSSWVARSMHAAALTWLLSVAAAPFVLWLDKRKLYGVITLIACLPLSYLGSISAGCF